jgi:hypothetical protein
LVHFSFWCGLRKFSAVCLRAIHITEIWLDVHTVGFVRQNDHKELILRQINRKYVLVIQALIFILIITVYLSAINPISRTPQRTDFFKFYSSAKLFWSGEDIYKLIPIPNSFSGLIGSATNSNNIITLHPNLNSPFHTLCISPFGLLEFPTAFIIWSVFSLCCGLAAIALFYKKVINNDINLVFLMNVFIIILVYYPTWINFSLGQFSFVLLLLLAIAWETSKKGNDVSAGIILGLATALKLFFGIFIILFIVYRRWRLISCLIGTFMICNILSIVIFTLPTFEKFFSLLQNMPWYAGSWNASFMGFFTRIFGGSMNIPLFNLPWLARTLSLVLSLGLMGWMIWLAQPYSHRLASDRFDLVFSLALVEMLLISPYGWLYYFPMLIFPMIVAWRASEKYHLGNIYKIIIVFSWALTTIPTSLIWAEDVRMNQPVIWFTSAGVYFYSLLIISGIFSGLLYKINKSSLQKDAV